MNIWYMHHYATPYSIPGLHRPFEFGKYFIEKGNEMTVFSSSYLHYDDKNMIEDKSKYIVENYDGVNTVFVKTCGYSNSGMKRVVNMAEFYFGVIKSAKAYAKTNGKPDVIVASSPHPFTMMAGIKLAKKYKVPCICEVRDFWPEVFFFGGRLKETSLVGKILLRGERWIYEKCNSLVFLKEGDYTYISEHKWDIDNGGKIPLTKCNYINNGVDIETFDAQLAEQKDAENEFEGKFIVTYCGTIRPVNNVEMLLDVAKLLDDDTVILIYGAGSCVEDIKKRIDDENITNVKLMGYVDSKYVPGILNKSSVNILNYTAKNYNWSRGNSSNKLFEYLASAKPVISNVKMGYDILEKYNCGLSVAECTAQNVADAIKQVKNMSLEEYNTLCANARRAAEDFDIPKLAADYMKVIENTKEIYKKEK